MLDWRQWNHICLAIEHHDLAGDAFMDLDIQNSIKNIVLRMNQWEIMVFISDLHDDLITSMTIIEDILNRNKARDVLIQNAITLTRELELKSDETFQPQFLTMYHKLKTEIRSLRMSLRMDFIDTIDLDDACLRIYLKSMRARCEMFTTLLADLVAVAPYEEGEPFI